MNNPQNTTTYLLTNDDDHNRALSYAIQSVDYTWDRMGITQRSRRQTNIYVGKLIEGPICREIESRYGITVDRQSVSTHYTQTDKGDVLLSFQFSKPQTGDIKSLRVRGDIITRESIADEMSSRGYALVPIDQINKKPKDIYIFTNVMLDRTVDPDTRIEITKGAAVLTYPRWAPLQEVQKWDFFPKGSKVYPYLSGSGTRYGNKGAAFRTLHHLNRLPLYLQEGNL